MIEGITAPGTDKDIVKELIFKMNIPRNVISRAIGVKGRFLDRVLHGDAISREKSFALFHLYVKAAVKQQGELK